MRKLVSVLVVVSLLMVAGLSFAEAPGRENIFDLFGRGGSTGVTSPTTVIKVRYANRQLDAPALASGDVVVWDIVSADGMAISACERNNELSYAGVLVTSIATNDGVGWMAIKGFVLARVDTSQIETGNRVVPGGATLVRAFGGAVQTVPTDATLAQISRDVGTLLRDTGTDGLMPVWLD